MTPKKRMNFKLIFAFASSMAKENIIGILRDNITRSKYLLNQFNEQLVVRIGDRGQNMVSLYLNSDEAELKKTIVL